MPIQDLDTVRSELDKIMVVETQEEALLHYNEIRLRLGFAQEAQRKARAFFPLPRRWDWLKQSQPGWRSRVRRRR